MDFRSTIDQIRQHNDESRIGQRKIAALIVGAVRGLSPAQIKALNEAVKGGKGTVTMFNINQIKMVVDAGACDALAIELALIQASRGNVGDLRTFADSAAVPAVKPNTSKSASQPA